MCPGKGVLAAVGKAKSKYLSALEAGESFAQAQDCRFPLTALGCPCIPGGLGAEQGCDPSQQDSLSKEEDVLPRFLLLQAGGEIKHKAVPPGAVGNTGRQWGGEK